jgi:hypothetical protein
MGRLQRYSLSVMRSRRYVEVVVTIERRSFREKREAYSLSQHVSFVSLSLMVRSLLERNLFCVALKVLYPLMMQRASTLRVV